MKNIISPLGLAPSPGVIITSPTSIQPKGNFTVAANAAEKDQLGTVLAVGDPIPYESNPTILRKTHVKIGDIIHHKTWGAEPYTMPDGRRIRHIRFEDVLSVEE